MSRLLDRRCFLTRCTKDRDAADQRKLFHDHAVRVYLLAWLAFRE